MAKISTYPDTPPPSLDDFLLGTDISNGNATQNFLVSDLVDLLVSRPYKVYTALLTQSEGSNFINKSSGTLTIGVTYQILNDGGGVGQNFTNVGAPNNNFGTYFVATGITPTSWGTDVYLRYNTGAPVVKVLENTIGNIWFTYVNVGDYLIHSNGLFTINKTFEFLNNYLSLEEGYLGISNYSNDGNSLELTSTDSVVERRNGFFNNTPIEIRVY